MKKIYSILLVLILTTTVFFTGDFTKGEKNSFIISSSETFEDGYRYNIQGWIYLHNPVLAI